MVHLQMISLTLFWMMLCILSVSTFLGQHLAVNGAPTGGVSHLPTPTSRTFLLSYPPPAMSASQLAVSSTPPPPAMTLTPDQPLSTACAQCFSQGLLQIPACPLGEVAPAYPPAGSDPSTLQAFKTLYPKAVECLCDAIGLAHSAAVPGLGGGGWMDVCNDQCTVSMVNQVMSRLTSEGETMGCFGGGPSVPGNVTTTTITSASSVGFASTASASGLTNPTMPAVRASSTMTMATTASSTKPAPSVQTITTETVAIVVTHTGRVDSITTTKVVQAHHESSGAGVKNESDGSRATRDTAGSQSRVAAATATTTKAHVSTVRSRHMASPTSRAIL